MNARGRRLPCKRILYMNDDSSGSATDTKQNLPMMTKAKTMRGFFLRGIRGWLCELENTEEDLLGEKVCGWKKRLENFNS